MRIVTILIALLLSINLQAEDWGKTGHRVTGAVADRYLNNKAKKAIKELLDGHSLAFTSTFADEIKSDRDYRQYGPWHYVNVPFDQTYDTYPHNSKGDIIQGIDHCIAILQSAPSTREEKAFHLKMLVHLIGDLHQPLHTGIGEDKGGNDFQVRWYNDGANLHSVWDTKMIESYGMSYTELADNLPQLNKKERKSMAMGTHLDWMEESRDIVKKVYKTTDVGDKLGYRYMYDNFGTVREQLLKGGVRLAKLLNELLG